jgi:magnesium transporter
MDLEYSLRQRLTQSLKRVQKTYRRHFQPHHYGGQLPGEAIAPANDYPTTIQVIRYSPDTVLNIPTIDAGDCLAQVQPDCVTWINVLGLQDTQAIQRLATDFHLSDLTLEDILHLSQRPKLEDFDTHLFLVVRGLFFNVQADHLDGEQISFILGTNWLITIQEDPSDDCFSSFISRIQRSQKRIRQEGADYLFYLLLDVVIDAYFPLLDRYGEIMEEEEVWVIEGRRNVALSDLYRLRQDLMTVRRAIRPLGPILETLRHQESDFLDEKARRDLRDCADHVNTVLDILDVYREGAGDLINLYLSTVSNRMNEVMKVLTLFSAIFIPLTFIVGVYGMNFEHIPELKLREGYYITWGIMLVLALGLLVFFWRLGWFDDFTGQRKNSFWKRHKFFHRLD